MEDEEREEQLKNMSTPPTKARPFTVGKDPTGGFDYAICGESWDKDVHGDERKPGRGIYTDIPTNPFIGDCIGINKNDFDKLAGALRDYCEFFAQETKIIQSK